VLNSTIVQEKKRKREDKEQRDAEAKKFKKWSQDLKRKRKKRSNKMEKDKDKKTRSTVVIKRLAEFLPKDIGRELTVIGRVVDGEGGDPYQSRWRSLPPLGKDQERFRLKDNRDIIVQTPPPPPSSSSTSTAPLLDNFFLPAETRVKVLGTLQVQAVALSDLCIDEEMKPQVPKAAKVPVFVLHASRWELYKKKDVAT
jgi:hypothetical protein